MLGAELPDRQPRGEYPGRHRSARVQTSCSAPHVGSPLSPIFLCACRRVTYSAVKGLLSTKLMDWLFALTGTPSSASSRPPSGPSATLLRATTSRLRSFSFYDCTVTHLRCSVCALQVILNCAALPCLVQLLSHQKRAIRKEAAWTISNITAGNVKQIQVSTRPASSRALWLRLQAKNNTYYEMSLCLRPFPCYGRTSSTPG